MTVKELIGQLEKCNPESIIVVHAREEGYDKSNSIKETYARYNTDNKGWRGSYETWPEVKPGEIAVKIVIVW